MRGADRRHRYRVVRLPSDQDCELHLDLPGGRGEVSFCDIDLELPEVLIPPLGGDSRMLGIGVRSLVVCAASNRADRLAYLEHGLLVAGDITHL